MRAAELAERERLTAGREGDVASLADRMTVLEAREADLAVRLAEAERQEQELSNRRERLDAEGARLAARARRLDEAERRSPIEPVYSPDAVGFSEGLRALARRRGAPRS